MAKYKITLNDVTVDIVDSYREACEIAIKYCLEKLI